jgi:2-polyprenyl-3-methyl-5-hydroxy-6-metoxy-1,4-benzoquinol methylase
MMNPVETRRQGLRVLAVIASYGQKNLPFLRSVIDNYRRMPFNVDVVVVSESAKALGDDVEVVVGLPAKNPWTLPFAHKPIMADRVNDYDLFVYSEDDIGATEQHLRAFLEATVHLEPDEIAGFMRYEVDSAGQWLLTEPWGGYHWKPESVRRRGPLTVAEFTNEHAGFYILTRDQLRRAIASGGFLTGPRQGRYQWPETAATDPYTICGFRKVMCISDIESFLVHHLPNPYVHQLYLSLEAFKQQIETLLRIRDGVHPATTLCEVESSVWPGGGWGKAYYERPSAELLDMVPREAKTILSIGCGWGETEATLRHRGGARVTALPLDSVIGAAAARRSIDVQYGTLNECLQSLNGRRFDCVLITNLLHLNRDPSGMVERCAQLVASGGALVLAGPNINRLPWLVKRLFNVDGYGRLRRFELSGQSICVPRTLRKPIEKSGLQLTTVRWLNHTLERGRLRGRRIPLAGLTAKEWALQARRPH